VGIFIVRTHWYETRNEIKLSVGEQFEEPKVIGLGLSLRTKERLLEVWIKDGRNDRVRTNVSNKLRHLLNLNPQTVTLYYKEHQKSIKVKQFLNHLINLNN
jgi:hypothetical protein